MERYLNPSLTPDERAEDLADRLTVEEQASQLRYDALPIPRLGSRHIIGGTKDCTE